MNPQPPSLTPLTAATALDRHFLEARSLLLDLAGMLDRIDRGANAADLAQDRRLLKIRQALEVLREPGDGRAERIQQIFSLDYDPSWERPEPK
jgi:hypothetical protein